VALEQSLQAKLEDLRKQQGLLGQLAEKTLVLLFTHHQHLVDIAKAPLGASVTCISLNKHAAAAVAFDVFG